MPIDLKPRPAVVRAIARGPRGPTGDPPVPQFSTPNLSFLMPDGSTVGPFSILGPEGPSGNARSFDTVAQATAAHIASGTTFILCNGRTTLGDSEEALWFKAVSSGFATDDKFQSADGQWWARISRGPIDVFYILGQSNAVGSSHPIGGPYLSPNPITGTVYKYRSGSIAHGSDPTGGTESGSMWPAFGMTVNRLTGRPVLIVNVAVGSSALAASADTGSGNWSSSGALRAAAFATCDLAKEAIEVYGFGVASQTVCWSQGEQESAIYGGLSGGDQTALATEYKGQLLDLINDCRTHFGSSTRFWLWETGTTNIGDGDADSGWPVIRQWQNDVISVIAHPLTRIVSRVQKLFYALGYMESGELHYNQIGNNLAGVIGASNGITGRDDGLAQIEGVYPTAIPYTALWDVLKVFGFGTAGARLVLQAVEGHGYEMAALGEGHANQREFAILDMPSETILLHLDNQGGLHLTGRLLGVASNTARASINIPSGTAPTSPETGDLWFDGTNLKFRKSGSTVTII